MPPLAFVRRSVRVCDLRNIERMDRQTEHDRPRRPQPIENAREHRFPCIGLRAPRCPAPAAAAPLPPSRYPLQFPEFLCWNWLGTAEFRGEFGAIFGSRLSDWRDVADFCGSGAFRCDFGRRCGLGRDLVPVVVRCSILGWAAWRVSGLENGRAEIPGVFAPEIAGNSRDGGSEGCYRGTSGNVAQPKGGGNRVRRPRKMPCWGRVFGVWRGMQTYEAAVAEFDGRLAGLYPDPDVAVVWAPSVLVASLADREARREMAIREDVMRDMLGRWVSELEPEMILAQQRDGLVRLIGLGYAGRVVVGSQE